jgi:DNA-binding NarL/FixJ family response regulator
MSKETSLKSYVLIVEDHPGSFQILSAAIQKISPKSTILNTQTTAQAVDYINSYYDRLELVSIDLGLPLVTGDTRTPTTNGIDLLRRLLTEKPMLNLMVNTGAEPKKLSGLRSVILEHQGGFVFLHKNASEDLMIEKIRLAMSGNLDYRAIKSELGNISMKPKWMEALRLAAEGDDNTEIAKTMRPNEEYHKHHDRTVDNYLKNAGSVLGVYSEDVGNFRVKLIKAARDAGLLD